MFPIQIATFQRRSNGAVKWWVRDAGPKDLNIRAPWISGRSTKVGFYQGNAGSQLKSNFNSSQLLTGYAASIGSGRPLGVFSTSRRSRPFADLVCFCFWSMSWSMFAESENFGEDSWRYKTQTNKNWRLFLGFGFEHVWTWARKWFGGVGEWWRAQLGPQLGVVCTKCSTVRFGMLFSMPEISA